MRVNWEITDVLRLFLAMVVVCGHMHLALGAANQSPLAEFSGMNCVVAFFLLSGFCIAKSLQKDAETRQFYTRRALRLMPEFVLAHLIVCVGFAVGGGYVIWPGGGMVELSGDPLRGLALLFAHFLPIQTIFLKPLEANGAAWSLGCEVFYYALAPLLLRLRTRHIAALFALSLVAYFLTPGRLNENQSPMTALALLWIWLCGWQLAQPGTTQATRTVLALLPLLLMHHAAAQPFTAPAVPLVLVALALLATADIRTPERFKPFARFAGRFSYTIYICHVPAMFLLCAGVHEPTRLQCWAAILVTSGVVHVAAEAWRNRAAQKAIDRLSFSAAL